MGDTTVLSAQQPVEPWNQPQQQESVEAKPKKQKKPKVMKQVKRKPLSAKKAKKFLAAPLNPVKLIWEADKVADYYVQFPKDQRETFIPELEKIPSAKFKVETQVDPTGKGKYNPEDVVFVERWEVHQSDETLQALAAFGKKFRFSFDADILVRAQMVSDEGKQLVTMSSAKSTSLLQIPKLPRIKVGKKTAQLKPYKFQIAGAAYALKAKKCFIADEMGLGKTIEAILTAIIAKKFPVLVVVPNTLKFNWLDECQKWFGKKRDITMLRNRDLSPLIPRRKREQKLLDDGTIKKVVIEQTSLSDTEKKKAIRRGLKYLSQFDVIIVNYDKLRKWSPYFEALKPQFVIFDESHYVKGNSERSRVCKNMMDAIEPEYILMLTGTPVMNKPVELIRQLQIMGRMAEFGGVNFFINRYCSIVNVDASMIPDLPKLEDGTLVQIEELSMEQELAQKMKSELIRKVYENQIELNKRLRSLCYVRREKDDVLTELPEKQRSTLAVEITNREEYKSIEKDVVGYLGDKAAKDGKFLKSIRKMSKEEQVKRIKERRNTQMERTARAKILVKIETLKQAAAFGKLEAIKEWVDDFFESNPKKKLIVFATHKRMVSELLLMLEEYNPVSIMGGDSDIKRNNAAVSFQTDKKVRLIIGTIKAMGVGLTLTAASDVLTVELGWTPAIHDQSEDRAHRITQKSAVTAYYLLGEDTIEMKIARLIESKRQLVDASSFGDPLSKVTATGSILGDLVKDLLGGKQSLL